MNYYKFHIGDYASATRHLSWDEDMAYRRLLDAYYLHESPLPSEKRQVYRIACASTDCQREAVDNALEEFFELTGDGWRHFRCDAEIANASEKGAKASQSARRRWEREAERKAALDASEVPPQSERNATAMRTHEESNANASKIDATHNPLPITQDPLQKNRREQVEAVFDCWRQTMNHPRAVLDKNRTKLIERSLKDGYVTEQLCQAIIGCSLSPFHMGDNDNGSRYDGLDLILRDGSKIDQFVGYFHNPPKPQGKQAQVDATTRAMLGSLLPQMHNEKVIEHEPDYFTPRLVG